MRIIDKVMECFAELGEGCDSAYDQTISLYYSLRSASKGKLALFVTMLILSSLIMTILFGVAMTAAGIFGPILLWVAFAFYSHSSPFLCFRLGFVLWWIVIQLVTGVSVVAVASLLWPF